jgi:hypothetical protein
MVSARLNGDLVRRRLREYVATCADDDHRGLAALLDALPLYSDSAGSVALRANGTFVFVPRADDGGFAIASWTVEVAEDLRLIAIAHGRRAFPELGLEVLQPARPDGAVDCRHCKAGWVTAGDATLLCGRCFGLGWRSAAAARRRKRRLRTVR